MGLVGPGGCPQGSASTAAAASRPGGGYSPSRSRAAGGPTSPAGGVGLPHDAHSARGRRAGEIRLQLRLDAARARTASHGEWAHKACPVRMGGPRRAGEVARHSGRIGGQHRDGAPHPYRSEVRSRITWSLPRSCSLYRCAPPSSSAVTASAFQHGGGVDIDMKRVVAERGPGRHLRRDGHLYGGPLRGCIPSAGL